MALPSITATDFQGLVDVTQDLYSSTDFEDAIDELFEEYLSRLIGNPAYTQVATQNLSRWDFFFTGGVYLNEEGQLVTLPSVRSILIKMIYAQWVGIQSVQNTPVGPVFNQNENSSRVGGGNAGMKGAKELARAAINWDEVCHFIQQYREQTVAIDTVTAVSATVFEITFDTPPPYLEATDKIYIEGIECTVLTINAGVYEVSYTVAAAVAPVAGDELTYNPFDIITNPIPKIEVGTW